MDRKKILVGVCCIRTNDNFFLSMYHLLKKLDSKYRISVLVEKDLPLPVAQNKIAEYFMKGDFEYLLWLEDDHYDHTVEMFDALLKGLELGADIVSMKYYSKGYPFPCVHSILTGVYVAEDELKGYHEVDLTGFGMSLMTRSVFERMPKPWFMGIKDSWGREITDLTFCKIAKAIGLKILGCWDHCLSHDGITQENVGALREEHAPSYIDRFLAKRVKIGE